MVLEGVKFKSLFLLAVVGVVLLVGAAITQALGMLDLSGFLTIYALVAFLLSGVGYASLFSIKTISRTLQRRRTNA